MFLYTDVSYMPIFFEWMPMENKNRVAYVCNLKFLKVSTNMSSLVSKTDDSALCLLCSNGSQEDTLCWHFSWYPPNAGQRKWESFRRVIRSPPPLTTGYSRLSRNMVEKVTKTRNSIFQIPYRNQTSLSKPLQLPSNRLTRICCTSSITYDPSGNLRI